MSPFTKYWYLFSFFLCNQSATPVIAMEKSALVCVNVNIINWMYDQSIFLKRFLKKYFSVTPSIPFNVTELLLFIV